MVLGQPKERNLTTHVRYKDDEIVSVARSITDEASGRVRGVIMIDLKLRSVSQAARNVTLGKSGYVMVTDAEGQSVYKPEHPLIEHIPTDWFPSGESGTFTADTKRWNVIIHVSVVYLYGLENGRDISHKRLDIRSTIQFYVVSFVFVVCLFGLSASLWFSRSIAQPISDSCPTCAGRKLAISDQAAGAIALMRLACLATVITECWHRFDN